MASSNQDPMRARNWSPSDSACHPFALLKNCFSHTAFGSKLDNLHSFIAQMLNFGRWVKQLRLYCTSWLPQSRGQIFLSYLPDPCWLCCFFPRSHATVIPSNTAALFSFNILPCNESIGEGRPKNMTIIEHFVLLRKKRCVHYRFKVFPLIALSFMIAMCFKLRGFDGRESPHFPLDNGYIAPIILP